MFRTCGLGSRGVNLWGRRKLPNTGTSASKLHLASMSLSTLINTFMYKLVLLSLYHTLLHRPLVESGCFLISSASFLLLIILLGILGVSTMSTSMTPLGSAPYATAVGIAVVVYFVIYPFLVYLRDTKGRSFCLKGECPAHS